MIKIASKPIYLWNLASSAILVRGNHCHPLIFGINVSTPGVIENASNQHRIIICVGIKNYDIGGVAITLIRKETGLVCRAKPSRHKIVICQCVRHTVMAAVYLRKEEL